MSTWSEQLRRHLRDQGWKQGDLVDIVADGYQHTDLLAAIGSHRATDKKSPSLKTINGYLNGETPTFAGMFIITSWLCLDKNWACGDDRSERWNADVVELRRSLPAWAAEHCEPDLLRPKWRQHSRIVALLDEIARQLPRAREEWFLCSVLNLGGIVPGEVAGLAKNKELYRQFLGGQYSRDELAYVEKRLSMFAKLPEEWLSTGMERFLQPVTIRDLGRWAPVIDYARRMGHTPEQYVARRETIDAVISE